MEGPQVEHRHDKGPDLSTPSPDNLPRPPTLSPTVMWGLFNGQGSPFTSLCAGVKNGWNITSSPPHDNFYFHPIHILTQFHYPK